MARKSTVPVQPTIPLALALPRVEVAQRFQDRINKGRELQAKAQMFHSSIDIENYKNDSKKWHEYNVELLRKLFTNNEVADEYGGVYYGFLARNEMEVIRNNIETTKLRIAKLESIAERLELYSEFEGNNASSKQEEQSSISSKVFVVHGHDVAAREEVSRFLDNLELKAIILHEQPDQGFTIIEKFETHANQVGFAVVLLTPDDLGGAASETVQASRARQNVIFELGYFVGKLGRGRACLMRKGEIEIPTDLQGVIYTKLDETGGWRLKLAKELKAAGLKFDPVKVLE